ncbi:MAG TPA: hypothetical protein VM531_08695 [Sphingomicrobium sp.]|nr:hypothetical protein [Sphingomicrobium sp.]
MCAKHMHRRFDESTEWRIGYNNGYSKRPPHPALINEPAYRDGYETGGEDRRAGVVISSS